MFLEFSMSDFMLWLLIVPLAIIFALIIVATIIRIRKQVRYNKYKPSDALIDQVAPFLLAYGGKDNITSVSQAMSRVSLDVKDIQLVDGEALKELGATGVLLIGQTVKCSYGDRAEAIYNMLKEATK